MTNKPEENNNYKMTKPDVIKAAMNKASADFEDEFEIQMQAFNNKMNSVGIVDATHIYIKKIVIANIALILKIILACLKEKYGIRLSKLLLK